MEFHKVTQDTPIIYSPDKLCPIWTIDNNGNIDKNKCFRKAIIPNGPLGQVNLMDENSIVTLPMFPNNIYYSKTHHVGLMVLSLESIAAPSITLFNNV